MATARQNVHDALAPLRTFPIGPVNGSQIRSIGLAVEAAIVAGLAGDTEDPDEANAEALLEDERLAGLAPATPNTGDAKPTKALFG